MGGQFEGFVESFPESRKSRAELLARARQLRWYHSLALDDGFTTEGYFALDRYVPYYLLPESLHGLDCLDVGTGNGYWAFLMEKRGARAVTATDIGAYSDTDFSRLPGEPDPCPDRSPEGEYGESFRVAATLLGSKAQYRIRSVYDLRPEDVGSHDVVFCGSVLMHLFGPLLALQRMSTVCRNTLLLTTQTDLEHEGESVAAFVGHGIPYVHFLPSPTCLVNMVRSCGYQQVLRGPTFHLELRDQARDASKLVHTSLIAFKDATHPCIDVAPRRLYEEAERVARIEVVSAPPSVVAGQSFGVLVAVENVSPVDWRGDGDRTGLRLGYEVRTRPGGHQLPDHAGGRGPDEGFVDYLPRGLSTLALVRVRAPFWPGTFEVRPTLWQDGRPFRTSRAGREFVVSPLPRRWAWTLRRTARTVGGVLGRRSGGGGHPA